MSNQEFVVADTVNGQVKGVKKLSCLDEEYISFQGIPFAKPPIGKLRFKVSAKNSYNLISQMNI